MAKSLSSLWLRSLRSISKTQRAQSRLMKSLLPKPARNPTVRKTPALLPKPPGGLAKAAKSARKPATQTAPRAAPLPGSWKPSYFSAISPARAASGKRMAYWLYLPSGASAGAANRLQALPLVVMLHGCQQTAPDFATATRMNQLAERKGFAVLYPQQSAASDAHRCWHWYQRTIQKGQGDVQLMNWDRRVPCRKTSCSPPSSTPANSDFLKASTDSSGSFAMHANPDAAKYCVFTQYLCLPYLSPNSTTRAILSARCCTKR